MRVLLTGHTGYIGTVLARLLAQSGHDVTGLDSGLFAGCILGDAPLPIPGLQRDLRDVTAADLDGFEAILHLAALSNDPLGNIDADNTFAINHLASVRLARLAKEAGVPRFLFASSCSLYGVADNDDLLDEDAPFHPLTPYGESKVLVERDVAPLADDDFSPVFLRNATAYGFSPRLRADIVVNNLVGYACTTGEVLIQSDGTPWRPLVHVEDIGRAFIAILEAPRAAVHGKAFNVGRSSENHRIRDLARMVEEIVPGSRVKYAEGGGPDPRSYRVDCDRLRAAVPAFQPRWTVRDGMIELADAYRRFGLTAEEFLGPQFLRIRQIQKLRQEGRLDADLRWTHASLVRPS